MYFKRYLLLTIGFTFLLLLIRILFTNSLVYIFLPWNIFLAYIPLAISNRFLNPNSITKNWASPIWFCVWLLFLPNAPYLITDLMHLQQRAPFPFYFDIVLVTMSVFNGLVFFFITVHNVELWWKVLLKKWSVNWFYFLAFGLCSFGIYLGRYGRFNSWNIITKPQLLLQEVIDRIVFPFEHPRTWAVTLLFSIMLFLFYQLVKNVKFSTEVNTN